MATCNCVKCGAEIRYVPTTTGHIVVEADYREFITDRGRVMQGHIRHDCPALKKDNAPSAGV